MSSASHAFGVLVHLYRELLNKEAGRRSIERRMGARAPARAMAETVEALERRVMLNADWTVMVYLNGDNNLEKACVGALTQLETIGSSANVNIVVQLDRSPGSPDPNPNKQNGYDDSHGDWSGAARGLVTKPSLLDLALGRFGTPLQFLGDRDSGAPGVLQDFVHWAGATYPAKHYALIIKDHGDGIGGISQDFSNGSDIISVAAVGNVLTQASTGIHLDVIATDACLMGSIDVAYQWKDDADYLVASEPKTQSDWYSRGVYTTTMTNLEANSSSWSGSDLAKDMVATVNTQSMSGDTMPRLTPFVAAIDLSKINPLLTDLNNLGAVAESQPDTWPGISKALNLAQFFDRVTYRDLGAVLENIETYAPSLNAFAQAARNDLTAAVIANRSPAGSDGNGLSVYMPDQCQGTSSLYVPSSLAISGTQWGKFVTDFAAVNTGSDNVGATGMNLAADPQGNIWFPAGNGVGRRSGTAPVDFVSLGSTHTSVSAVLWGPDGNIWASGADPIWVNGQIQGSQPEAWCISPITGAVLGKYALPYGIWTLTTGPDGNIWGSGGLGGVGGVVKITPSGGAVAYACPFTMGTDFFAIRGICAGPDGNIWYTASTLEAGTNMPTGYDIIGQITPTGFYRTPFHTGLRFGCTPLAIVAGPDGNLWFTEGGGIGRITADGAITNYSIGSTHYGITVGRDGNIWFTDSVDDFVGSMSTTGHLRLYQPNGILGGAPFGITSAPDGKIWYTLRNWGQIAFIATPHDLAVEVQRAQGQRSPTNDTRINFTVTFTEAVFDFEPSDVTIDGSTGASTVEITDSGDGMTYTVTVSGMARPGDVGISIPEGVVHSWAGDSNLATPDVEDMVTFDNSPLTVTVNQAAGQADPTSYPSATFDIIFNKPVRGFYNYEVAVGGTAPGSITRTLINPSGDKKTWELTVTGMTGYGTITASVAAGWVVDAAGNENQPSTSTDNTVTYSPFLATPPSVTVEQSAGQADPTTTPTVSFTAVFSTEVTDLTASAVTLSGTAPGATVAAITDSGDHKTYTITVSGMTASGTVIASIGMNIVHDVYGQGNFASTSHDNTVTYALAGSPTVTVAPMAGQPDPTGIYAFVTLTFSKPIADFSGQTNLLLGGTAPGTRNWAVWSSSGSMSFTIRVWGMTGNGTVTVTVPPGAVHASTGEPNLASGSSGGVVNYETMRATAYPTPTMGSSPQGIVAGPDGNLWFTEYYGNKIGKITPSGVITEYSTGTTYLDTICVGPDNNLWFTTANNTRTIGKITTAGVVTLYRNITASGYYLRDITAGPDGNLWFTADYQIGKMTTSGVVTGYYALGPANAPRGITEGPDGNLWFTTMYAHEIGRITTAGAITWFTSGITGDSWLPSIAAGPDGNLWFAENMPGSPGRIGRITTDGVVTEFTTGLSWNSSPYAITAGADGNMWYLGGYLAGRITTAGVITEYSLPHSGVGLTAGPDGRIWYTDGSYGDVVRLDPSQALPVTIDQAASQGDPAWGQPIHYTVVFGSPVVDFTADKLLFSGTAAGTPAATITDSGDHMSFDVAVSGLTDSGTLIVSLASGSVHDADGNASQNATSTDNVVVYYAPDFTPPSVTIDRAAGQADPTNVSPVHFQAVFSEPVPDFTNADVLVGGTAGGNAVVVDSGDYMTFDVWVTNLSGSGLVTVTIPAGLVHDFSGNLNLASTSTDNQVMYDITPATVTIDQAAGQSDPASGTVHFTATFSEPVVGFTTGAVVLDGTAPGATVQAVIDSGDHMTFDVWVSGMTGSGSITAAIPAGVVQDLAGNANLASTSTDNEITYDDALPSVTIDQAADQTDPATSGTISFTVVFSKPVLDFGMGGVTLGGTAPGATVESIIDSGDNMTYTVTVSGMTGPGTVVAMVLAGAAHDELGNANTSSTSTDNVVTWSPAVAFGIADANLEAAIRQQLFSDGYTPGQVLTAADMQLLTSLDASYAGITDLTGLEYATNLQSLNLAGNAIGDAGLVVIAKIKSLTILDVSNCGITSLAALAPTDPSDPATGMPNLTSLRISSNWSLADYSAIRTMPSLTSLDMGFCGISDTTPLNGLTNLTYLYLFYNNVSNLNDISTLTGLHTLYIGANFSLSDLSGIENLTSLQALDVSVDPIGQAGAEAVDWSVFTSLTFLGLRNTGLTDLGFLSNTGSPALPGLVTLDVQQNSLTSLSGIEGYAAITNLYASYNQISDISAVNSLSALRYLNLYSNQVSDLSPLAWLTNLDVLTLSYNSVTSLEGVQWLSLGSLRTLSLDHNNIRDIAPLWNLPNINNLYLAGNRITNVAVLGLMPSLSTVDLESNRVWILSVVDWSQLTNLQSLNVSHNRINIDPASPDGQIIQSLVDRGVSVSADPQDYVNTVPVVTIDPPSSATEGVPWTGSGSFTDPNDDLWWGVVEYGDGNYEPLSPNADKTFNFSHTYAAPGDYTITVSINDGMDLGTMTASVHINAIVHHLISDPNLENAIRQQLGLGASDPVTQADLESLTQLDASNRGITDLTGLEYATNLKTLEASGNSLSDLTPILGLVLNTLNLNNTGIGTSGLADIASHLTGLTHLEVQACNIGDFSSLASLTSLMYLSIGYNGNATGLDAIGGLTSLTVLYAANTGIPATALVPLNALRELDVNSCGLTTLSFLEGKQLTLLNLGGNPIADISLLGTQANLWWLSIDGMGLNQSRIAAVDWSGLSSLSVFTFSGNPIGSLSFLTAMPQLLSVGAWGTGVSDISPLASLTGIHYLVLGSNPITDLSPLNSLIALENLNIHDCELTTLGQVQWSNLKALWGLGAMHNHLSTYTGGPDAQIIADLQARGVGVFAPSQYVKFGDAAFEAAVRTALSIPTDPISSDAMLSLTSLDLSGQALTSIAGIEYAESLTSLDLRETGLDLTPGSPDRARVDLLISRGVTVLFTVVPDTTAPTIVSTSPANGAAILASSFSVDVWFSEPVQNVDATDLVLSGRAAASAVVGTPVHVAGNQWRFPVSGVTDGGLTFTLGADVGDITDASGNSLGPVTWSCNANVTARITYSRYPAGAYLDLYVMNSDGSNQENITNDQTAHQGQGYFSHDGSRIVYAANGIWVMNADGTANTQLTTSGSVPIFSPDNSRIVYYTYDLTSSAIHIMNADGTGDTVLSANKDAHPRFSPDGTKIVFDSARDGGLGPEIYVMNVDGTNQTRLTNAPTTLGSYEPCYSPDGSKIVFAWYGYNDAHREIYIMNVDGTGRTRLTSGSASKDQPCFSPDGTKIAYTVSAGLSQIYLMNTDGTGQTQLTLPGYGSEYPSWVTIDKRPPAVRSIVPAGASPTNATTLQFAVTFRESVWGVAASDFVLATTGTAHAVIASLAGSGANYTVTVNSAGGNGSIGLNLLDDDTIEDQVGNKLGGPGVGTGNFTGQTYTLDNTPPAVATITRLDANPTNAYQLRFYVRFSERVAGVDKTDFAVAATGTATGSLEFQPAFDGSGYTVTISNISGDGNLGLNLVDNDSITDTVGNLLGGAGTGNGNFTGQVYTVDHSFPTITSMVVNDGSAQRSMVGQVTFTFSEVVNLDSSAFSLTRRDGSYPADLSLQLTNPSGDKMTYALTFTGSGVVSGSLPDGAYNLSVHQNRVADPAGNWLYYNYRMKFHRLFGDFNGDRVVDRADLVALRQHLNQPASAADGYDYDGNGVVDIADVRQLKARLRRRLL